MARTPKPKPKPNPSRDEAVCYESSGEHLHYPVPKFNLLRRVRSSGSWRDSQSRTQAHHWIVLNSGRLAYEIDGACHEAGRDDFVYLKPGQIVSRRSLSGRIDFYEVVFEAARKGDYAYFLHPSTVTKEQCIPTLGATLRPHFAAMLDELRRAQPWCEEMVESTLWQMTWLVRRRLNASSPHPQPPAVSRQHWDVIQQARRFMEHNLLRSVSLTEIAEACYVSPCHLGHVFKAVMDISPLQYALRLRMEEAKKLLAEPAAQVGEVAMQMGFEDVYYFSRQFKKINGISPRTFQMQLPRTRTDRP